MKVKVLGISGSPRGEESSSEAMLVQLLKESEKHGAETEIIRLCEKNILHCEGCYSKTSDGGKCTFPCIHEGKDDTMEILNKIIYADALVISSSVYWGSAASQIHALVEKMTCIENNFYEVLEETGREPTELKPFALLFSQEGEGASLASSQLVWALNGMGFMLLPYGVVYKHSILNSRVARMGLRLMGNKKHEWIDNTIRLLGRSLALLPAKLEGFEFDDLEVEEPRC